MRKEPLVDDIRYYYFRDEARRPRITLCRIVHKQIIAYGWAICSLQDNPHKEDVEFYDRARERWTKTPGGRSLARGRAMRALRDGVCVGTLPTVRVYKRALGREEAWQGLLACHAESLLDLIVRHDVTQLPVSMRPMVIQDK